MMISGDLFQEGRNYFAILANEDSNLRLDARADPFYNNNPGLLENLPSLYSDPFLIPRFHYSIRQGRNHFPSQPIYTPEINANHPSQNTRGNQLTKFQPWMIEIGGLSIPKIHLEPTKRNQVYSTRYLSIRDIVGPHFSEEEVLKKIEELHYRPQDRNSLYRLVKILYAGSPSEEREIVSNLFRYEKEFAEFLRERIFHIEILPLIHGIFLQDLLTKMDERIIRADIPKLSPPVLNVIRKSVSKNKFQHIMESPLTNVPDGETLTEKIESAIFQRFSRKIYYEEGSYIAYRVPGKKTSENPKRTMENSIPTVEYPNHAGENSGTHPEREIHSFSTIDSGKFWIGKSHDRIQFLEATHRQLFFRLKDWTDVIRFDIQFHHHEFKSMEFYRLPPGIILSIPFYPQAKSLIGGGIGKDKLFWEFSFSNFS